MPTPNVRADTHTRSHANTNSHTGTDTCPYVSANSDTQTYVDAYTCPNIHTSSYTNAHPDNDAEDRPPSCPRMAGPSCLLVTGTGTGRYTAWRGTAATRLG